MVIFLLTVSAAHLAVIDRQPRVLGSEMASYFLFGSKSSSNLSDYSLGN